MKILIDKIRVEGNSLVVRMQPIAGAANLTSLVSKEIGVTEESYFEKRYRYSTNGIIFGEWQTLTEESITSLSVQTTDTLVIEFLYLKKEPQSGSSTLDISSIEIEAVKDQSENSHYHFNKTVFKEFFDSDGIGVLNWHLNILDKLYQRGIVPNYINRVDEDGSVDDFLDFWEPVTKFFSYYVNYARQFEHFYKIKSLLSEYLKQRGLFVSPKNSVEELNVLMSNFYREISGRGTAKIVDENGEFLRLIEYDANRDDIAFNLHSLEHFGWNLGNSSPLHRGLHLNENINKCSFEQELQTSEGYTPGKIKVDGQGDYHFSFLIKAAPGSKISIRFVAEDEEFNQVDLNSNTSGLVLNNPLTEVELNKGEKYRKMSFFLYGKKVESARGIGLVMGKNIEWITPHIEVNEGTVWIDDVKFTLLRTPYSHGLVQTPNWISCLISNRSRQHSLSEIEREARKYLIPYNSRIKVSEIGQEMFFKDRREFSDEFSNEFS